MRALIVDDEPLARRGILLRLKKIKDIKVVSECGNGPSAIEKILTLAPDLVLLINLKPGWVRTSCYECAPRLLVGVKLTPPASMILAHKRMPHCPVKMQQQSLWSYCDSETLTHSMLMVLTKGSREITTSGSVLSVHYDPI